MRFGVCHAVTLPGTWEEVIAQAGQLGFEGIELFVSPPQIPELLDNPERAAQLRQAANRAGVAFPSLCLSFFGREPRVYDPDPTLRAEAIRRARAGIARCAHLGGAVVLLPGAPALDDADAVARWIDALRTLVPDCERHQVKVAIETGLTGPETLQVLSQVGSLWIGDYFDMGNAAGRDMDPAQEILTRGQHIAQIHAKGVRGALLEAGTVDVPAVARALRSIGYQGWIMLETSRGERPLEAVGAEREQLLRLFAG